MTKLTKRNYVWVGEMQMDNGKWTPVAFAQLTKREAQREMSREWKPMLWTFRVRRYVAEGASK